MQIHYSARNNFQYQWAASQQNTSSGHIQIVVYICPDKALFSTKKDGYLSYLSMKTYCGYSLEAPWKGASNEYPQCKFSWRNKKNINIMWMYPLKWSYEWIQIHISLHSHAVWSLDTVQYIQLTLIIWKSKALSELLRHIRTSTYQICRIEETINRTILFTNEYVIWFLKLELYWKYCGKEEKLLLSLLFHNTLLPVV